MAPYMVHISVASNSMPTKTEIMWIGSRANLGKLANRGHRDRSLCVGDEEIKPETVVRGVGVYTVR